MIFIAGTDTEVGKTLVTGLLAHYFTTLKKDVITQKWVQSGASVPEDILAHLEYYTPDTPSLKALIPDMCPYILEYPASPHYAAIKAGVSISAAKIIKSYESLKKKFKIVLCEGSGGILVPLNDMTLMAEIVKHLDLTTILVVPNKLGMLNHTFTHVETLFNRGISCGTIIVTHPANTLETPEDIQKNNIETLKKTLSGFIVESLPFNNQIHTQIENFKPIGDKIVLKLTQQGRL